MKDINPSAMNYAITVFFVAFSFGPNIHHFHRLFNTPKLQRHFMTLAKTLFSIQVYDNVSVCVRVFGEVSSSPCLAFLTCVDQLAMTNTTPSFARRPIEIDSC